jgi:hypothetical protein
MARALKTTERDALALWVGLSDPLNSQAWSLVPG